MACVIGVMNPTTQIPALPVGLKIDNNWSSQPCAPPSSGDGDDNKSGLIAGLVMGWLLFALLLALVVGIFVYRYIRSMKATTVGGERDPLYKI